MESFSGGKAGFGASQTETLKQREGHYQRKVSLAVKKWMQCRSVVREKSRSGRPPQENRGLVRSRGCVLLKSSVLFCLTAVIVDAQQDLTNKEERLKARWGADGGGWLGDDEVMWLDSSSQERQKIDRGTPLCNFLRLDVETDEIRMLS